MRIAAGLAAALLLVASTADPAAAQGSTRLPDRDRALAGQARALFAVGKEEGQDWELLDGVSGVAFDDQDNLYLLDRGNARILVFDRDGRFVRQIARKGQGPGELVFPMGMTIAVDGSLVVNDLGRGGFSLFRPTGEFVRNVLAEPGGARLGGMRIMATPAGGIVYPGSAFLPRSERGPLTPTDSTPIFWHSLAEDARPAVFARVPTARPVVRESAPTAGERRVMISGPPVFGPTLRWSLLPGGELAVAATDAYALTVYDRAGKPLRTLRRDIEPRRVTDRDREAAREDRKRNAGRNAVRVTNENGRISVGAGGPPAGAELERMLAGLEFAATVPVIRSVSTDGRGRLWIERVGRDPFAPGAIDVVTGEGRYVGTLPPQPVPAAFSRSGRAAYIEDDPELGFTRVVVRQLPAGW